MIVRGWFEGGGRRWVSGAPNRKTARKSIDDANDGNRKSGDHAMEALHESERQWETLRFPGQWSKMLFHPRPERPTEPNAGFVRYEPGAHHPMHRHDFAQIWY